MGTYGASRAGAATNWASWDILQAFSSFSIAIGGHG
jgi:hypothetical protein